MLILSRKVDESFIITLGDLTIEVMVIGIERAENPRVRARVALGIKAPAEVIIMRKELLSAARRGEETT